MLDASECVIDAAPARDSFSDDDKRTLQEQHCDPAVREPFIAVLATHSRGCA